MSRTYVFIATFAVLLSVSAVLQPARAAAAEKIIAFQLEGTLVQSIPSRNTSLFSSRDTFSIDDGDRSPYYMIRRDAVDLLVALNDSGYKIKIYTNEKKEIAKKIAANFSGGTLSLEDGDIFGRESMKNGAYDLSVLSKNVNQVLYVGSSGTKLVSGQEDRFYDLGPAYFAFPSYEDAKEQRKTPPDPLAKYFPKSEDDWYREYYKLPRFYAIFKAAQAVAGRERFQDAVKRLKQEPVRDAVEAGESLLTGSSDDQPAWRIVTTKNAQGDSVKAIRGCSIKNSFPKGSSNNSSDLEPCIKSLGVNYTLKKYQAGYACRMTATVDDTELFVADKTDLTKCIENSQEIRYLLRGTGSNDCAVYTNTLEFLQKAKKDSCNEQHIFSDPSTGKSYVTGNFEGIEKMTSAEVLRKLTTIPNDPKLLPAVQSLQKYVYELTQPYYVWHWFDANGRPDVWQTKLSAVSPEGYSYFQMSIKRYWNGFCPDELPSPMAVPGDCAYEPYGRDNMFGPGLYTSIDPVATQSYGGNGSSWVVMQVKLPQGFRVMDLAKDASFSSDALNDFLDSNGCDSYYSRSLEKLMKSTNLSGKCSLAVRRLFKDGLKIDAFLYGYESSRFNGCGQEVDENETKSIDQYSGPFSQRALVIASSRGITANEVRVFNSKTPDAKEDRLRLLSFFSEARGSGSLSGVWKDVKESDEPSKLISPWLKKNVIGCQAKPPYQRAKKAPAAGAAGKKN